MSARDFLFINDEVHNKSTKILSQILLFISDKKSVCKHTAICWHRYFSDNMVIKFSIFNKI